MMLTRGDFIFIFCGVSSLATRSLFLPFNLQVGGIRLKLEGSRLGVGVALGTSAADGLPETARCDRCELALGFPSDWIVLKGDGSNDLLLAILQASNGDHHVGHDT